MAESRTMAMAARMMIAGILGWMASFAPAVLAAVERLEIESRTSLGQGRFEAARIHGELHVPAGSGTRVPVVVLMHGCNGVSAVPRNWAVELNAMGHAALILDSFAGRGINEVCSRKQSLGLPDRVFDAYRALDLLTKREGIDASKTALMGFSHGGSTVVMAAQQRFRAPAVRAETPLPAAFLAFYPGCNTRRRGDTVLAPSPLRIFHGTADDWTPIEPCRAYVERTRDAGADIGLTEYPGAHHGFDSPTGRFAYLSHVLSGRDCAFHEREDGRIADDRTGEVLGRETPSCMRRGASVAPDHGARRKAIEDVKRFLTEVFGRAAGSAAAGGQ
jgi:dienelactone hydrolase